MNPGPLIHKITPYLTNGKSAVAAVIGNHPYPARDLLITLAVLAGVVLVTLKIAQAIKK